MARARFDPLHAPLHSSVSVRIVGTAPATSSQRDGVRSAYRSIRVVSAAAAVAIEAPA
jgi:hypothetical protein